MVGPERCADQAELLTFFDLPIALLQTAAALERVTAELVEDLARGRRPIRRDSLGAAPPPRARPVRGRGHRGGRVGIARAAATHGPATPLVGLIVTAMRQHPPSANVELARVAAEFGPPLIGFDLAGPEAAWPAPPHAAAFNAAQEGGLALTAHAGEVPGADARARGARPRRQPRRPRVTAARGPRPRPAPPGARRHARPVPDLERAVGRRGRPGEPSDRGTPSGRGERHPVDRRPHGDRHDVDRGAVRDRRGGRAERRRADGDRAERLSPRVRAARRHAAIFAAATRAWDAWWSGQTIT